MARARSPEAKRLGDALAARTAEATLYEKLEGKRVRCLACGHRCVVLPGLDGVCRVRFNDGGVLRAPRGYVAGLAADPIEKKPFFHVMPGRLAMSFGMLGCDLHCPYCQNWLSSQTLRDDAALSPPRDVDAERIVRWALEAGAPVVVSTYNEPLITAEWAVEVFTIAKREGLLCGFVSNGNATPEVLRYLRPCVDLYKVDLKGFREEVYRSLGGRLATVLDTIGRLREMGFWLEIVTLLVPGLNDGEEELRDLARFIVSVSPDVPWHVTAFHGNYKMRGGRDTRVDDLARAAAIGRDAGLRYVYAGNLAGRVGGLEDTRCPGCGASVIERRGYTVLSNRLTSDGACEACGTPIPGRWSP